MRSLANSLATNLIITALMLVMVFAMPWVDRRICRRLGLNLQGGISSNPHAERLLRLRQSLLYAIFGLYLAAVAYLTFFSRAASDEYMVHVALYTDLKNAVRSDLGIIDLIKTLFTEGFGEALSHIRIVKAEDITQVYMNIMMFIPMGYMLPYIFAWFREKVRIRPVVACFLIAFLIENLQLVFRRGFYDMDDLVSNTIGGLIGQFLFLSAAYVVTHPNWRRELREYRRWRKNARSRTLYPFMRRMSLSRATLEATNEEEIRDFYVMKLGFRLIRRMAPADSEGTDMLLSLGRFQVEVHCTNRAESLPPQTLTLSALKLAPIIRRLETNGIETGKTEEDPFTGMRRIRIQGPDSVTIYIVETNGSI